MTGADAWCRATETAVRDCVGCGGEGWRPGGPADPPGGGAGLGRR